MRKVLYFTILTGCLSVILISCKSNVQVRLKVHTSDLDDLTIVYVSGNHPELGNWNPGQIALTRKNKNMWSAAFTIKKDYRLEYKFTLGSWQNQALTDNKSIPPNHVLTAKKDTAVMHYIKFWQSELQNHPGTGITGSVRYHRQINYSNLLPRDVIVWLPPGYKQRKDQRFPVLYMHDGQNIIDPATSFIGIDWQVDETVDSLIRINKTEPFIVVGIYNTRDRNAEYSPGIKGTAYMDFIVKKLKPFIDKTYRTNPDRINTATAGSSMGGLISMMLLWEHSEVFSKAACFSPAFKTDYVDYASHVRKTNTSYPILSLYIDNGGVGLEERLQPGITDMLEALKEKSIEFNYIKDKTAEHNEAAWARRFHIPLNMFFSNND